MELSSEARNLNWLVQNFAERVPGVNEAVVVSSDGLPIATSSGLDRDAADRFAAVASGLIGLAYGAAGRFGGGAVNEVIIEMENAFLFVTGISDGSCLACRGRGGVRRRPGRLRDGRPGREGRRRPHARAPGRAAEQPFRDDHVTATSSTKAVRRSAFVRTCSRRVARAPTVDLPLETLVKVTPQGVSAAPRLALERKKIVSLCNAPISIAEISAHLERPSGRRPGARGRHGRRGSPHQLQAATRHRRANVPT